MMILAATLLIALAGLVLGRRRRWLVGVALAVIFLTSWPPVGWLMQRTLEFRYHPAMPPAAEASAAIVVLGGYMERNDWGGPALLGTDTYQRLAYAAALHRHWPTVPIVVSGGRLLGADEPPLGEVMADYLGQLGIPPALVVVEPQAGNTHENAVFSVPLLPPEAAGTRTVAVVTHATHMRRAQRVFEAQQVRVLPAPCCFDSIVDDLDRGFWVPNWWTLRSVEGVLHEWLGLLVYALRGWI